MKRILAAILVCLMLAACAGDATDTSSVVSVSTSSVQSSTVTSQIDPAKNEYKEWNYNVIDVADRLLLGNRVIMLEDSSGMLFDQAGCSFSFKADCEGDIKLAVKNGTSWENRFRHYTVYIDGVRQERIQAEAPLDSTIDTVVTIAADLPRGIHEIKVCRSNPAEKGVETIKKIVLNGVICEDKPKEQALLIEFLGDSLTAGLGNLDFEKGQFAPQYSDSTQTYAFFTAEAFGADFSSVCCGGLPFTADYGGMTLKERYNYVSPYRKGAGQHDFARSADIVVINLGTNDHGRFNDGEITEREYIDTAKDLMTFIKLKNPNAKIVWAYGMATNPSAGALTMAVNEMGGADAGYYFCKLPGNIAGEKGHPVVESHRNAANVLIQFMKDNLGLKEVTVK